MTKAEEILEKHLKINDVETMLGKHGRTHNAVINALNEAINYTRCCTKLKDKEEMNLVEYAISEGYTYNNENHYFYKGGRNHLFSNVRDKYIKEVVMDIDITKHL